MIAKSLILFAACLVVVQVYASEDKPEGAPDNFSCKRFCIQRKFAVTAWEKKCDCKSIVEALAGRHQRDAECKCWKSCRNQGYDSAQCGKGGECKCVYKS